MLIPVMMTYHSNRETTEETTMFARLRYKATLPGFCFFKASKEYASGHAHMRSPPISPV